MSQTNRQANLGKAPLAEHLLVQEIHTALRKIKISIHCKVTHFVDVKQLRSCISLCNTHEPFLYCLRTHEHELSYDTCLVALQSKEKSEIDLK